MDTTSDTHYVVAAGAGAAKLLEAACERGLDSADTPRIELVRDLAEDLGDQLEALANLAVSEPSLDLVAEAALRCADLANLAACNLDGLPAPEAKRAAAGVHLASGAVRALRLLAESEDPPEPNSAALRDVSGAGWRADLAFRQVEELMDQRRSD